LGRVRTDKLIAQAERHDLLTRMYLRHYAFLRRSYPRQSPRAIYHFATLGLSGLLSSALLALLAAASLAISLILARPVVPWTVPEWALIIGSAVIALVPGLAIDRRFRNLIDVNQETVEQYSSGAQRRQWWLMLLSIVPICGTVAVCFGVLRTWQNSL
jgi:hypothetical protein